MTPARELALEAIAAIATGILIGTSPIWLEIIFGG